MKSPIKITTILFTAAAVSLAILTEVKPAKSQSAPLANAQPQSSQKVPEPGTIAGLLVAILGGLFVKKQIAETETPELPDAPKDSKVETTEINSEDNSEEN